MTRFSRDFIALQCQFADIVRRRFGLSLSEAIQAFTTLPKTLKLDGVKLDTIEAYDTPEEVAGQLFAHYVDDKAREQPRVVAVDEMLFGCFYYKLLHGGILRIHFIDNDESGGPLIGSDARIKRRAEVGALFDHVNNHVPEAKFLQGNSWLYNLKSYQSLFPPAYVSEMSVSDADEFNYLALWGQFFTREWQVRTAPASVLLTKASSIESIDRLVECFPFRVLQPKCEIALAYEFYG